MDAFCPQCARHFDSQESLRQHNSSKHADGTQATGGAQAGITQAAGKRDYTTLAFISVFALLLLAAFFLLQPRPTDFNAAGYALASSESALQVAPASAQPVAQQPQVQVRPTKQEAQSPAQQPQTRAGQQAPQPQKPLGKAVYKPFSQQEFEAALRDGKVVLLDFFASWCVNCHRQRPEVTRAFDEINDAGVMGFEVNYDTENALKSRYGVAYQNTKVFLDKRGNVAAKTLQHLQAGQIKSALEQLAAQA